MKRKIIEKNILHKKRSSSKEYLNKHAKREYSKEACCILAGRKGIVEKQ